MSSLHSSRSLGPSRAGKLLPVLLLLLLAVGTPTIAAPNVSTGGLNPDTESCLGPFGTGCPPDRPSGGTQGTERSPTIPATRNMSSNIYDVDFQTRANFVPQRFGNPTMDEVARNFGKRGLERRHADQQRRNGGQAGDNSWLSFFTNMLGLMGKAFGG